jgi:hypothetical protein
MAQYQKLLMIMALNQENHVFFW